MNTKDVVVAIVRVNRYRIFEYDDYYAHHWRKVDANVKRLCVGVHVT